MMEGDLGRHLFTFAVVSDSHVNEEEDRSASPYACNRLANARFRYVVHALNQQRPAFTVHLGDMANPLPELATYRPAAERFATMARELQSPLHLAAGNHCLGDKPGGWVPVPRVSARSLEQYREIYGQSTYSFEQGPCHFVILSSLLINSGLEAESDQRRWVERDLAAADEAGKRIWVMMHYPAYIGTPDELGSYDNVDQPGRSWLLHLFEEHDVEAVFSGHVHNYFYNRYAGTDLYTVPATSFVRQDYGELYQVAPPEDSEGGRDDAAKLGYCLVEVYERGHLNRVVRTGGRGLAEGSVPDTMEPPVVRWSPAGGSVPVSIEMRESWLSRIALRTNNSVSPFTRRSARNDWAVLALQEMGVSRVRVSLQELANDDVVERMANLQEAGFEFIVYSHGIPGEREYRWVREHRAQLAGWELIMRLDQVHAVARRVAASGLPCYLNEIRDLSRAQVDDANVKHEANYGFQPTNSKRLEKLAHHDLVRKTFRGLVFRIRRRGQPEIAPWHAVREVSKMSGAWGMRHQVHILFSGNLTADRLEDDLSTANRVAEATLAAWVAGNVDLTFDTFEDVDRGYFVRHGLVDRLYNPRMAARVVRHLQAALAERDRGEVRGGSVVDLDPGRLLTIRCSASWQVLVLPGKDLALRTLDVAGIGLTEETVLEGTVLDLEDGTVSEVQGKAAGSRLDLSEPIAARKPLWLEFV